MNTTQRTKSARSKADTPSFYSQLRLITSPRQLRDLIQQKEFYQALKKSLEVQGNITYNTHRLITIDRLVKEGNLKLDRASTEIKSDKHSFAARWIYLLSGQATNPELSQLNAIQLCQWFPKTREGAELRLSIIKRIEQKWSGSLSSESKAFLLAEKGDICRLLATFDPVTFVSLSIDCYKRALITINDKTHPFRWAKIFLGFAIVYRLRRTGVTARNLERSIRYAQAVLKQDVFGAHDPHKASLLSELGVLYRNRLKGNHITNQEKAISYFQQSLSIYSKKDFPQEWGRMQLNLGNLYMSRVSGYHSPNVEKAIGFLKNSLEVRKRVEHPIQWGNTMISLGNAFKFRVKGDITENREQAIQYFQEAELVFNKDAYPHHWAGIQLNLGDIYRTRTAGLKADNIKQSIRHLRKALQVWKIKTTPHDWALVMYGLGNSYLEQLRDQKAENLEHAITCFKNALKVWTRGNQLHFWAQTVRNIANTYYFRILGEPSNNIELALYYFDQALSVDLDSEYCLFKVTTYFFKARTLMIRKKGKRPDNLKQAATCIQTALTFITPETESVHYRQCTHCLGSIRMEQNDYSCALEAFQEAAKADSFVHQQTVLATSREHEFADGTKLYFKAAFCSAKMNNSYQSLDWLERGKTRFLSQIMTLDRALVDIAHESDRKTYRKLIEHLKELEREQQLHRHDYRAIAASIRKTRIELDDFTRRIRTYSKKFLKDPIDITTLFSHLEDEQTVILELFITEYGSGSLFFYKQNRELKTEIVINDQFTDATLNTFSSRWNNRYRRFKNRSFNNKECLSWGRYIDKFMEELSDTLFLPILNMLHQLEVKKIILVPHRQTHIFPLHLLNYSRNNYRHYLIDEYEVVFIPSLTIAAQQVREKRSGKGTFVGIANPTYDLWHAQREIAAIEKIFQDNATILQGSEAQLETVTAIVQGAEYVHLACHAIFNGTNPYESGLILADPVLSPQLPNSFAIHENQFNDDRKKQRLILELPNTVLTLADIFCTLQLTETKLVVLSSCESGKIDTERLADEFIGLPAGFLFAGAQNVVSSLWMIDDQSTSLLMERFYFNVVKQDMTLCSALRDAQLWLRSNPQYSNPYYWAAFQLWGF